MPFVKEKRKKMKMSKIFFKFVIVFMCNLSDLIVYNRVVMEVVNSYTELSKSLIKGT